MFWKNKKMVAASVSSGGIAVSPSEIQGDAVSQLKAVKQKIGKLSKPRQLPERFQKYIIEQYKMAPEIAKLLYIVMNKRPQAEKVFDCRVFDNAEAEALNLKVDDYTFLNERPDLILYEGWFDEDSKSVELIEKRKMNYNEPVFTETEIKQKIEALRKPGSTVFFWQAQGPAVGGPMGRGAAIVELNPAHQKTKRDKKYIVYTSNVFGTELVGNRNKLWDSNDPKKIARWIQTSHNKRTF